MADNNITKFLRAILASAQDIENAAQQLFTQRTIDNAVGAQLDVLGAIVGQARNGMADADYRRYIRVRILVNKSNGTIADVVAIAKLILNVTGTGYVEVRTIKDATFILEVKTTFISDTAVARAMRELLDAAVAGGVRIVIVYATSTYSGVFRLDSGPGLDVGQLARSIDSTSTP